ncbi:probable carboxylesterase 2 [Amborella trichopoda]|uniref:probable carboxylesterase 2 n=1 Tax=Amborella trichopoda TaxID=13333 RepID=UPI0009C13EF0|nr:probable carboxylesterase 2 [Amborella trichopoda]|eukprot:XP_011627915.2 probable carboxylesterase 2 [Amborella trichopoda]
METTDQPFKEYPPFVRIHNDGTVERHTGTQTLPPSPLSDAGVSSKDVVISPNVSARLYIPHSALSSTKKLPTLVYFHGGGFIIESPFSPHYHPYQDALAAKAGVIIVSVNYRLAPEHQLPAAYDDSWEAIKWTVGLSDEWLRDHADLDRLFLAGDSSGGNIVHQMAMRAGETASSEVRLRGVVLVHPFFWGPNLSDTENEQSGFVEKLWKLFSPDVGAMQSHWVNWEAEGATPLTKLGCRRVMVCVAELDFIKKKGKEYYEALKESGWEGKVELVETEGENHVFHLFKPDCEKARVFMEQVVSFLNQV